MTGAVVINHTPVPRALDALEWLAHDHAVLKRLLRTYRHLRQRRGGDFDRALLAGRICSHLNLHLQNLQIEEEIFPRLWQAGLDTVALGAQIAQRSKALVHDLTPAGGADRATSARAWPLAASLIMP